MDLIVELIPTEEAAILIVANNVAVIDVNTKFS